jgi:hypothetical protein
VPAVLRATPVPSRLLLVAIEEVSFAFCVLGVELYHPVSGLVYI